MTPEKILLYEIRETISQMSEDDRIKVEVRATTLRNMLKDDMHALMAFALVSAEQQAAN